MPPKDPEAKKAYRRQYYKDHKEQCNANFTKWRKGKGKKSFAASVAKCQRKKRDRLKKEIFEHYGGTPPKCACCGETIPEFLTIDHVNNDGSNHRREVFGRKTRGDSLKFYMWIVNNNFPDTLQILCMNCNWGKRLNGICPHKTIKSSN
jgi:hypothetical protein